jgi:2'-5' RNA ligase
VAAEPDPAALDHLDRALNPVRLLPGGPRWIDRARWHLTLTFLGELAEEGTGRLDRLTAALAAVPAGHHTVHLRLSEAGTFPAKGPPQVLWVGVTGEPDELDRLGALARATARAARHAGVRVERRPFHPHLTLGRWRRGDPMDRGTVATLAGYGGPAFRLTEVVLMRSHLGPRPRYERLTGCLCSAPGSLRSSLRCDAHSPSPRGERVALPNLKIGAFGGRGRGRGRPTRRSPRVRCGGRGRSRRAGSASCRPAAPTAPGARRRAGRRSAGR